MKPLPRSGPAIIIASGVMALTLAVGGGAVAGSLITSSQIQDDTVRSADIKNGTLKFKGIAKPARTALAGQDGTNGISGYQVVQAVSPLTPPGFQNEIPATCPAGKRVIGLTGFWTDAPGGVSTTIDAGSAGAVAKGVNPGEPGADEDRLTLQIVCATVN